MGVSGSRTTTQRLLSLDCLRGFAMFMITGGGLILLALGAFLPDSWAKVLQVHMNHSAWDGVTFLDLIFPLFLFLSGVAFTISWQRQCTREGDAVLRWRRLALRTLMLIALGVVYNEISWAGNGILANGWEGVRWFSVLGRIGFSIFIAALFYNALPMAYRWILFPLGLLGYWLLLIWLGGEGVYIQRDPHLFWTLRFDRWLVPSATMADPEGVISSIGAIFTAYAGMCIGDLLRLRPSLLPLWFFLLGVGCLCVGLLLDPMIPIIKFLWTPTYVLVTAGWACLFLMVAYLLIDVLNLSAGCFPLSFIGMHALWFYFMPWVFDFNLAGWKFVGGITRLLDCSNALQVLIYYLVGYCFLWGSVFIFIRGFRKD